MDKILPRQSAHLRVEDEGKGKNFPQPNLVFVRLCQPAGYLLQHIRTPSCECHLGKS